MVGIVGVDGPQHADIVDALGKVRQQFADRHAALAVRSELKGRRQQACGLSLGSKRIEFCGPLSFKLHDARLRIEEVGTKRPAVHEEVNDPLCAGSNMRREFLRRRLIQQAGQANGPEAASQSLEHVATRE